jgi:hypothetical protein
MTRFWALIKQYLSIYLSKTSLVWHNSTTKLKKTEAQKYFKKKSHKNLLKRNLCLRDDIDNYIVHIDNYQCSPYIKKKEKIFRKTK